MLTLNIEEPKSAYDCPFYKPKSNDVYCYCLADKKDHYCEFPTSKCGDCPIVRDFKKHIKQEFIW